MHGTYLFQFEVQRPFAVVWDLHLTYRYGSRFLTPTSGCLHQAEFLNFGRPFGAPTPRIFTTENTNKIGPSLVFWGVDNILVPLQESET